MGIADYIYIEVTAASILIMAVILLYTLRSVDTRDHRIAEAVALMTQMVYLLADIYWVMNRYSTGIPILLSNICLYSMLSVTGYFTTLYCMKSQDAKFIKSIYGRFLMAIPAFVNMLLVCTTNTTHLLFYLDEDGRLVQNGHFYNYIIFVAMLYLCSGSVLSVINAFKKNNVADRPLYLAKAAFLIPLIAASVLQVMYQDMPFVCFGLVLSMLIMHLASNESLVSLDTLTQINNRLQLRRHLNYRMLDDNTMSLILVMLDVDGFKQINDTYGHVEGDEALKRVATALKSVCGAAKRNRFFVARYGGDEFTIVATNETADAVKEVCVNIQAALTRMNNEADAPYPLNISCGIAERDDSMHTMAQFIQAADKKLYEEKNRKNVSR